MKTIAQEIAEIFGNDGWTFDKDDQNIKDISKEKACRIATRNEFKKYIFEDESSIITFADSWDFGTSKDDDNFSSTSFGEEPKTMERTETFRSLVMAVEENNRINDGKWSDWENAKHIQSVYGQLDDINKEVYEVFLNALINDNGANLSVYEEAYDCLTYRQPFAR